MATTPVLHTDRLTLRPFRLSDASAFVALAGALDVARMTSDIPHPLHVWQCRRWLRQARGEIRFAIERDGELIGGVGYFCHRPRVGELGFWLGQSYWGEGLATEAARAVVRYAFTDGRLTSLTSANFNDNPASARILSKLAFAANGRMHHERRARPRGRRHDLAARSRGGAGNLRAAGNSRTRTARVEPHSHAYIRPLNRASRSLVLISAFGRGHGVQ